MRKSRKLQRDAMKAPRFPVKIMYHHRQRVTRQRDPEDSWSGDDLEHTYDIQGFNIVPENGGWDFILTEKPTGSWYLVCAHYSTGDSFHREEGELSLVSFVKNEKDAEAIVRAIQKDYEKYRQSNNDKIGTLRVNLPVAGRVEEVYTGTWKGYFERLQYAEAICLSKTLRVNFTEWND
jgi:hypothetical protein